MLPPELAGVVQHIEGIDRERLDALVDNAYHELKGLAHRSLRFDRASVTLNTTGLVHEAYEHLAAKDRLRWESRAQFLALAAVVMRHLTINRAQERLRLKRGGGAVHLPIDEVESQLAGEDAEQLMCIDAAIEKLAAEQPRAARVVECRFFAGLSQEETADALGISLATAKRDWTLARAWLGRALRADG
jgi:RNA polymerase sigma-70 factor, ECF subfamily